MGQNEELAKNLDKIVTQLEIISNSLLLLEQRISTNEEQVAQVFEYFREVKEQHHQNQVNSSGFPAQAFYGAQANLRNDFDVVKNAAY